MELLFIPLSRCLAVPSTPNRTYADEGWVWMADQWSVEVVLMQPILHRERW
jgi:hypothetical protein